MPDDPQQTIVQLLQSEHGIARSRLLPSSRLLHDLQVDGDDAVQLFQKLHDRYGTDFRALGEQWSTFFGNEGPSIAYLLLSTAVLVPSIAISVPLGLYLDLSSNSVGLLAASVFFGSILLFHGVWPKSQKRPVTIAGLAEIVRRGSWPSDPSLVR